jgi:sulfur transfer complex TusBCD TusB component (DsrH family)
MNAGILEGSHTHPAGVRLSDSLRNAASTERYLLLSDVVLHALDGSEAHSELSRASFMLVNTAHAHAIVPLDEAL